MCGTSINRASVNVDDVEEVYRRIQESEWPIEEAKRDQPWGGWTLTIRDMNGFIATLYEMMEYPTLEEMRRRQKDTQYLEISSTAPRNTSTSSSVL